MKIAIIDCGINFEFFDFKNIEIECFNMSDFSTNVVDENGHGTASVGEILKINNQADLLVIKVLDQTAKATLILVIEALEYCLQRGDVQIISLSLSCDIEDFEIIYYFEEVVRRVIASGIFVVCSISNNFVKGKHNYGYPAFFPEVIKVRHQYSSVNRIHYNKEWNEYVFCGSYNLMPFKNNEYKFYRGNSAFAPRVAALLSMSKPEEFQKVIKNYYSKEFYGGSCNDLMLLKTIRKLCREKSDLDEYIEISDKNCVDLLGSIESERNIKLDYMKFCMEDFVTIDRLANKCLRAEIR